MRNSCPGISEDRLSKTPPAKGGGRENLAPCSLSHWEKWNQLIPVGGSIFHPLRMLETATRRHMVRVCRQLLIERAHIVADMLPAEPLYGGAGIGGQPRAQPMITQHLIQPLGKCARVAPAHQQPIVPISHDARQTTRRRCDDRRARGERLDSNNPKLS